VALLFGLVHGAGMSLDDPRSLATLVFRFALLNTGLAIFNMIPVPPLDGSKVLMSVLPRPAAARYEAIAGPLSWVFLLLLFSGAARVVLAPVQGAVVALLLRLFG
jgi:Zn-dependent protease